MGVRVMLPGEDAAKIWTHWLIVNLVGCGDKCVSESQQFKFFRGLQDACDGSLLDVILLV